VGVCHDKKADDPQNRQRSPEIDRGQAAVMSWVSAGVVCNVGGRPVHQVLGRVEAQRSTPVVERESGPDIDVAARPDASLL